MRERLRLGEAARLVGVTPKTVRHYEKIGLLPAAERSESGYRHYAANDLLHLNRVKRLRSLGLSLRQVRSVLGEGESELSLKTTLEALRTEVEAGISRPEERRRLIDGALSREGLEAETSPSSSGRWSCSGNTSPGWTSRCWSRIRSCGPCSTPSSGPRATKRRT